MSEDNKDNEEVESSEGNEGSDQNADAKTEEPNPIKRLTIIVLLVAEFVSRLVFTGGPLHSIYQRGARSRLCRANFD